jgi:regulation of enolase protein 1 (concanavalin A-like superfamily)
MEWLNEPKVWKASGDTISLTTEDKTDFWQSTFYGFEHDNGHFYFDRIAGDFTAELSFEAAYEQLYDQAGLMLRFSERSWLKAGVEYVNGKCTLATVLTRDQSDWAIGPEVANAATLRLRLTRLRDAVCVQWAPEDAEAPYETLRLGPLPSDAEAMIGPMSCSPSRAGLKTRFKGFKILPPVDFAHAV